MTWDPLILSLEVAVLAMLVSLVLGTAIALGLVWKKLPAADLFDAIASAPLVLPPTVLGYYLLVMLGAHSAIGRAYESLTGHTIVFSFVGAVIAAATGSLPLVIRSARVGLESVDPTLIDAAKTLGAGRWRVLTRIVLPLAAPGIIAGAMLGFARALGDYGITQMLIGGELNGTKTASIYVMDAYTRGNTDDARNMAIVTTLVGIGMLWAANKLTKRLHLHRA